MNMLAGGIIIEILFFLLQSDLDINELLVRPTLFLYEGIPL